MKKRTLNISLDSEWPLMSVSGVFPSSLFLFPRRNITAVFRPTRPFSPLHVSLIITSEGRSYCCSIQQYIVGSSLANLLLSFQGQMLILCVERVERGTQSLHCMYVHVHVHTKKEPMKAGSLLTLGTCTECSDREGNTHFI